MGLASAVVCRVVPVAAFSAGIVDWRVPALWRAYRHCRGTIGVLSCFSNWTDHRFLYTRPIIPVDICMIQTAVVTCPGRVVSFFLLFFYNLVCAVCCCCFIFFCFCSSALWYLPCLKCILAEGKKVALAVGVTTMSTSDM